MLTGQNVGSFGDNGPVKSRSSVWTLPKYKAQNHDKPLENDIHVLPQPHCWKKLLGWSESITQGKFKDLQYIQL